VLEGSVGARSYRCHMRLLHTSDWHLGRSFHGEDLLSAQAAYVDHLIETVEAEEVDLVVVSGDVYDRALPSVDAVELADEALHRLGTSRARVVITSGNHDSQRRLGFNSRLVDLAGVHLRTDAGRVGEPVLLDDAHGPVAVYGIPYLEPDILTRAWELSTRSHHSVLAAAMDRVRADLATRPEGTRSVVLAHAFVAGGISSESERDISVGGISVVPLDLFDGIDYTALGHLHGRATLSDTVRYSGSPVAYSFSEADHVKGSWLVDLGADGFAAARFVPAPVPRPLARLEGSLEELLTAEKFVDHEQSWVQATLTDPTRPLQAMERLRARFPHALALRFAPGGDEPESIPAVTLDRSAHDVALDFVSHVRGGTAATPAESDLLREALECCSEDPDLLPERDAVVSG
jgi:DNA repair protein SbcD/Mre11